MKTYNHEIIDAVCDFWLNAAIENKYYPVKDVDLMKYVIDNFLHNVTFGPDYTTAKIIDRKLIENL